MINFNSNILYISSMQLNKKYIISANIQERSNFYSFPKHTHQSIEIYYFLEGYCKMDIGEETLIADTGSIVLILPNVVHSFYLDSQNKTKFIHIHFKSNEFNLLFSDNAEINIDLLSLLCSNKHYYKIYADSKLHLLLHSIIEEKDDENMFIRSLCNLHLIELLIYILKENDIASFFLNRTSKGVSKHVLFAFKYIEIHYSEKVLISDISNLLNISSRYLSKLFYEATNLTIIQYLNLYRVNTAINLMYNTDQSLTEISLNVGLGDIQHFSNIFKKTTGINPRYYKQLLLRD